MQNDFGGKGLTVIGVTSANADATRDFAEKRGVNYTLLAAASQDMKTWGIRAVPATVLLGPDGQIVAKDDLKASSAALQDALGG